MIAVKEKIQWGDFLDPNDYSKGRNYPLHAKQLEVYNSTARFTAAIAGTGGGKTVLGPLWIIKQIQERYQRGNYRPILGMVIAPTYKVLDRATVPTLLDTFKYTALQGTFHTTKNLYTLPDGGKIWCQGADNPGGLEGGQFDFVWIDEGGQVKYSVWVAVQGRTGQKQAPVLITTTPYGKNWLYHEFHKKWLEGDDNYKVVQWASYLNPTYSIQEYERAKIALGPEKGAMRYDGQFMALEGLIYPNMPNCYVDLSNEEILKLISGPGKLYGGLDFGWNDPFSGHAGYLDENDVLWIWWERYKAETTIERHAEALPLISGRTIKWWAEHEPEFIIKLRRGGHKVKKANKSVIAGIEAVNARINTGRLKIIERLCPALVGEAEGYIFDIDEDDMGGDKPLDENNHAMDSLRYMVAGIDIRKAA